MTDLIAEPSVELMATTPDAERVIEPACRKCYLSFHRFDPPASTRELIEKVIKKGHQSVLEHAGATFRIKGGSSAFTHELARHRLMSPSQESQRYVEYGKTRNFNVVLPGSIENSEFKGRYLEMTAQCEKFYTEMVRADIQMFAVRCRPRAHWEIRRNCLKMLEVLKAEAPIVFDDFKIDWETESARIVES